MHPILPVLLFFLVVNACASLVIATLYWWCIYCRNKREAASHWLQWRIPKDRRDFTFLQVFLKANVDFWSFTILWLMFNMLWVTMTK
jgi:hypothetical protein